MTRSIAGYEYDPPVEKIWIRRALEPLPFSEIPYVVVWWIVAMLGLGRVLQGQ